MYIYIYIYVAAAGQPRPAASSAYGSSGSATYDVVIIFLYTYACVGMYVPGYVLNDFETGSVGSVTFGKVSFAHVGRPAAGLEL
jgi:hypothetical protein